ncbi:hypothetical protein ACIQOU_22925 [Streptomyces sp. NPDC091279]|uniref:hypothetical protein n=1 Tax=Streptomyces sp. NPDC091279 TaxID=3365983 RepID=UPI00382C835B
MRESYGTYLSEAQGAVHTGAGSQFVDQHIYVQAATSRLREQASRRKRVITEEDRKHLAARFLPPAGMQLARTLLATSQVALIGGLPGSGRQATALMLLHELPGSHSTLHELPDTSDDTSPGLLDVREIDDGARLLLDLSEAEESRFLAVQEALFDFREGLKAHGAHLAVVLPHRLGYLLRGELKRLTVEIGRPSPRRLLARHLLCDGVTFAPEDLKGSELGSFLTQAPVRDVAGLADRIRRLRETSPADRGFPDWLTDALLSQRDQSARVAADLSVQQSGPRRALLLSLALFHGTTPETVLQAANSLLTVLSHPPDITPRLEQADLYAELHAIEAETDANGQVRFRTPGYDQAVRNHFWTFLPDIRRQLRDWFKDRLIDPALPQPDRTRAVERFAFQALRTARPRDLIWLAEQWMARETSVRLIPDAAQVLALGLDDDRHGRLFRQQIYEWAVSPETGNRLRRVLVVVCAETMARTHPDQALVRLHHLARRASAQVTAEARAALTRLIASDNRLYCLLLGRLKIGIVSGRPGRDPELFLALADPVRLIGRREVREALVSCWTGVLQSRVESWEKAEARWLTAAEDLRHRDQVLRVLALACGADPRISGQVYRVALRWSRTGQTGRSETVTHLLRSINTAQGIEPYDSIA